MKKLALLSALVVFSACACTSHEQKRGTVNLGPQQTQVTLISGNNVDLNLSGASHPSLGTIARLVPAAGGSTLTGILATSFGDGDLIVIRNDTASATDTLTLTNADTTSLAADRFLLSGANTVVLQPKDSVFLEYDALAGKFVQGPGVTTYPTLTRARVPTQTAPPALSTCGTSPTITAASTDMTGDYTTGSAATTCTITFATPYAAAPTCIVAGASAPTYTTSTTALTVSVDVASTSYHYLCIGH